jgi:hypothetical protein
MSTIKSSTTTTTAYQVVADTTGALVIQTGATPTTALTISSAQVVAFANPPTGVFPSGTAVLFAQTAAPTGWTKSTTHDNKALRVVSGVASSGGSVAFTTAFASQAVAGTVGTSGATTLTTSQIPIHVHGRGTITTGGSPANPGTYISSASATVFYSNGGSGYTGDGVGTDGAGGGGSHTHSGGTFTGTAINLAVQYVDVIIATKD